MVSAAFALRANQAGIAQDADALGVFPRAMKDEAGLCVTPDALAEALANQPPGYTDSDVEVVLVDGGYVTLADRRCGIHRLVSGFAGCRRCWGSWGSTGAENSPSTATGDEQRRGMGGSPTGLQGPPGEPGQTVQPVSLGRTDRMEFRWFLPR